MGTKIQAVRGTQDLLPETSELFRQIDAVAYQCASRFGYGEIRTPIFEFSEVFHRGLGETSDMVSKETYDFKDRGGDSLTLRPEGTAGVVRALVSNGLAQNLPLKYYYCGPMFRYERPQKGRYRQFHQLGVESLGFESPLADVESISLANDILKSLGLTDKIKLEINTIGDVASRQAHRDQLVSYLSKYEKELSADSQVRLHKNPLRIFDSKEAADQKILVDAPLLKDHLNADSKKFFDEVLNGLQLIGLAFTVSPRLVRGIDYYTHSVFEFTTEHLGSQSAVVAGGRYNGLVEQFGGPNTPSVGWASGIERLALLLESNAKTPNITHVVIPADEAGIGPSLKLASDLRSKGFRIECLFEGSNVGKKMKRANKLGAKYAMIIGSQEVANNQVAVKNLETGQQELITTSQVSQHLK